MIALYIVAFIAVVVSIYIFKRPTIFKETSLEKIAATTILKFKKSPAQFATFDGAKFHVYSSTSDGEITHLYDSNLSPDEYTFDTESESFVPIEKSVETKVNKNNHLIVKYNREECSIDLMEFKYKTEDFTIQDDCTEGPCTVCDYFRYLNVDGAGCPQDVIPNLYKRCIDGKLKLYLRDMEINKLSAKLPKYERVSQQMYRISTDEWIKYIECKNGVDSSGVKCRNFKCLVDGISGAKGRYFNCVDGQVIEEIECDLSTKSEMVNVEGQDYTLTFPNETFHPPFSCKPTTLDDLLPQRLYIENQTYYHLMHEHMGFKFKNGTLGFCTIPPVLGVCPDYSNGYNYYQDGVLVENSNYVYVYNKVVYNIRSNRVRLDPIEPVDLKPYYYRRDKEIFTFIGATLVDYSKVIKESNVDYAKLWRMLARFLTDDMLFLPSIFLLSDENIFYHYTSGPIMYQITLPTIASFEDTLLHYLNINEKQKVVDNKRIAKVLTDIFAKTNTIRQ